MTRNERRQFDVAAPAGLQISVRGHHEKNVRLLESASDLPTNLLEVIQAGVITPEFETILSPDLFSQPIFQLHLQAIHPSFLGPKRRKIVDFSVADKHSNLHRRGKSSFLE